VVAARGPELDMRSAPLKMVVAGPDGRDAEFDGGCAEEAMKRVTTSAVYMPIMFTLWLRYFQS
jgi:hypothetical protein